MMTRKITQSMCITDQPTIPALPIELEQMLDRGDAVTVELDGRWGEWTHRLNTNPGSIYLVRIEGEGDHAVVHNRRMLVHHARACALLQEALDWIGVVNITEREETLAHDLQCRIDRLLAEVWEC